MNKVHVASSWWYHFSLWNYTRQATFSELQFAYIKSKWVLNPNGCTFSLLLDNGFLHNSGTRCQHSNSIYIYIVSSIYPPPDLGICIECPGVDDRAFHKAPSGGGDAHVNGLAATEYGGEVVVREQEGRARRGDLGAHTLTLTTVVQPHADLMIIGCIILDPRPEYIITVQVEW